MFRNNEEKMMPGEALQKFIKPELDQHFRFRLNNHLTLEYNKILNWPDSSKDFRRKG